MQRSASAIVQKDKSRKFTSKLIVNFNMYIWSVSLDVIR